MALERQDTTLSILLERSSSGLQSAVKVALKNHAEFCQRAAKELGTDPAIIAAYLVKESYGAPARTGENIHMLFMVRNHWTKKYRQKFPGRPLPSWSNLKHTDSKKIWAEAYRLWPKGALSEASWGIGQVHPWSYRKLGYSSEIEMVRDFKRSVRAQEDGMINFIKTKPILWRAIRNKDWWAMARFYNGGTNGKYARDLRKMYNAVHPNNKNTQRIANSIKDYELMKKRGQIATSAAPLPAAAALTSGAGIALIGDSNAWRINKNYEKSNPNSDDMHQGAWGARHWLKTLQIFEEAKKSGKTSRDFPSKPKKPWHNFPHNYYVRVGKLLNQNPSRIDVTMLGGNDAHKGTIGTGDPEDNKLVSHIDNTVKPLMQIIKKYGGTYAGAAAAPKRLELRVKLNTALEKAAKEVGIPFYNPTKNIAYDMKKWGGAKDRVHILDKQAEAEFLARKQFYLDAKGLPSGGGGLPPELQNADVWKLALGARAGQDISLSPKDAKKTTSSKAPSKSNDLPDKVSIVSKSAANADQLIKLFNSKGGNEVRHYFVRWLEKGAQPHYNPGNKYKKITSSVASQTWGDIIKYADTGNVNSMKKPGVTLSIVERFLHTYNNESSFRAWLKNLNKRLAEVKGNTIMKITQERLVQIIKEEIEAYKASQLNEGIDADELDKQEAYIKEITDLLRSTYDEFFKAAAPAVGTPQTKADTGEPVTDQTAHEDAKGLLLDLLGNAIDKFQEKDSMHEDGHEDVPSAVRAMKTMAEDALEMLDALEQMDGTLPTWWTNKMAVSASMLNKMRDYLLVPSEDEVLDEQ
tara:strand:- start:8503 stop:10917 length:2415 start_codon:yes stop_codon:yes gene_type:complete